MKESWV